MVPDRHRTPAEARTNPTPSSTSNPPATFTGPNRSPRNSAASTPVAIGTKYKNGTVRPTPRRSIAHAHIV